MKGQRLIFPSKFLSINSNDKLSLFVFATILTILISFWTHAISKDYVYTEPTADYNILGNLRKI